MGYDFSLFWQIGRLFIEGGNPYAIDASFYPPAAVYFFAVFALLPYGVGFYLISVLNAILIFISAEKLDKDSKNAWLWLLHPPAIFVIAAGQLDIIFLYISTLLIRGGTMAAISGCLLTLKPQLAFVALPWFIVRWLKSDRDTFARWLIFTTGLHAIPLAIHPELYK